jgi:hypothetical protein
VCKSVERHVPSNLRNGPWGAIRYIFNTRASQCKIDFTCCVCVLQWFPGNTSQEKISLKLSPSEKSSDEKLFAFSKNTFGEGFSDDEAFDFP